ncbi:hypothetical protein D3C78_1758340 [compost metagenome]
MQLVRVQDDGAARQAVAHAVAIAEAVHAGQRATDGIGVVPVRREAMAAEVGFHALQPGRLRRAYRPIPDAHLSFASCSVNKKPHRLVK